MEPLIVTASCGVLVALLGIVTLLYFQIKSSLKIEGFLSEIITNIETIEQNQKKNKIRFFRRKGFY